ncbi:MAG: glycosyltransferase, partial [Acidobacteriota bacterium]|nr:glycosyltransferase [Acidobacteriota bacterium]
RNILPKLSRNESHHYLVLVPPAQLESYTGLESERLQVEAAAPNATLARMWWEQTGLRRYIKSRRIDVLVSLGNFALFASPVPQILFNRNDLYFSPEFTRDLQSRKLRGALLTHRIKSWLARQSIKHVSGKHVSGKHVSGRAAINVAPTEAFANRIQSTSGLGHVAVEVLRFGFDVQSFTDDRDALPEAVLAQLNLNANCRRLLYVSHYNYFRNFETLIRALPLIKSRLKQQTGEDAQLVLTTDIQRGAVYGGYDATAAAELIDGLGVREDIAMLGPVDYGSLHQLYRLCDVFVCPSYSESFGHPLVEAMASGLPIVSADLPVHREVCGTAAIYFDVFDEAALSTQCVQVLADKTLSNRMKTDGLARSHQFSWDEHVRQLEMLIQRIAPK